LVVNVYCAWATKGAARSKRSSNRFIASILCFWIVGKPRDYHLVSSFCLA
jgi:hypothetical protein